MVDHERLKRPSETRPGGLRSERGNLARVLTPYFPAAVATVTAYPDQERGDAMPERHMREPAGDGIAGDALSPAVATPGVRLVDPALKLDFPGSAPCPIAVDPSSSRRQKVVRSAGWKVAWSMSGSFGWAVLGTPIIARPRSLCVMPLQAPRLHPQFRRAGKRHRPRRTGRRQQPHLSRKHNRKRSLEQYQRRFSLGMLLLLPASAGTMGSCVATTRESLRATSRAASSGVERFSRASAAPPHS